MSEIPRVRLAAIKAHLSDELWRELTATLRALDAQLSEAKAVLSRVQWGDRGVCSECGGFASGAATFVEPPPKDGHAPDCRLAKLIS